MQNNSFIKPASTKICVLYDPQDGRVVHTHSVVVLQGARDVTEAEVEASAKDRAEKLGHEIAGLSTLRVAAEDCDRSSQYRVDLETKTLKKIQHPTTTSHPPRR